MKVTVLGAGAWGTTLALLAHQNHHAITLWGHDPERLQEIERTRTNDRSLPNVVLPAGWRYEPSFSNAIDGAELIVVAIPSRSFRSVVQALGGVDCTVLSVTKGIEFETGLTMSGILEQEAPKARAAALSGPSIALEVARGIPTAVVAASRDESVAKHAQHVFHRPTFRVYTSGDPIGVEMGGALKNVIAIAAGVCDGLRFGDNAKAALITRGMAEMRRIGVACGARGETFSGLSGLGDLTVTCFSQLSRNRGFGERIGKGEKPADILSGGGHLVEGYPTARSAREVASRLDIPAPITSEVYGMLYEGKNVRQAVVDLLSRDSKSED
jgi:glycerol-3-phosphate dehydrogenase (NAD(P)+)